MSALDEQFYGTIGIMQRLASERLLTDASPLASPHNDAARILRLGLAVTAFALLEGYIEGKFDEVMDDVSHCVVPYANFKDELKRFITIHAVGGIANRASFMDRGDALSFAEASIARLAAFSPHPGTYTSLGFSPRGSNVSDQDIETAFGALGVGAVWSLLSTITHEIGGGVVSLRGDYKNLARTRHRSAHNASHNVPSADLLTHLRTAIIVGVAISVLTRVVGRVFRAATTASQLSENFGTVVREYRFLDEEVRGTWIERTSTAGRPLRRYSDRDAALAGAGLRSGTRIVVLRNTSSVPVGIVS